MLVYFKVFLGTRCKSLESKLWASTFLHSYPLKKQQLSLSSPKPLSGGLQEFRKFHLLLGPLCELRPLVSAWPLQSCYNHLLDLSYCISPSTRAAACPSPMCQMENSPRTDVFPFSFPLLIFFLNDSIHFSNFKHFGPTDDFWVYISNLSLTRVLGSHLHFS